jgi:glycosyltransferase involved in cell wall biosynthesis
MEKKVLTISSTFPRWKGDSTPRFVYDLSNRIAHIYRTIVLVPHHKKALKNEKIGKLEVKRFMYFKPESMQKLCYGGGMIPNIKSSFLARTEVPFLILSEFFVSYKIIKNEQIGMVHAHWMLPQGLVAAFLKKIFKIPVLITLHGSDLFALNSGLSKLLQKFVVKNADSITVNSVATKNELVRRFPNYPSKIKIIPMGVDTEVFKKRNVKKPKKYSKNKILLFVGRLSEQKGLQYLIDAMPDIIKQDDKVRLLVIGEGAYGKTLKEKLHENNLEKYVEFLGSLNSKEISKYYNMADIFVMPSLSTKTGTEALGLSLLEAMACGCTVVGTNVGGIPFILKNNQNGILVKQKDKKELSNSIIKLLKNKSIKLGNKATISVKRNYSWDKVTKDFLKIYKDILK